MARYKLYSDGIYKITIDGKPQTDELIITIAQLQAMGYDTKTLASKAPKVIAIIAQRFETA